MRQLLLFRVSDNKTDACAAVYKQKLIWIISPRLNKLSPCKFFHLRRDVQTTNQEPCRLLYNRTYNYNS